MKKLKVHIQYVMLWELKNNKNTSETANKICSVNGQGVVTDHQVQNWFSKFSPGNRPLKDEHRQGSQPNFDQNAFRELGECNSRKSTRELAPDLIISQCTICRLLKEIGKVN